MHRFSLKTLVGALFAGTVISAPAGVTVQGGDLERGARAARACMACHSLTPGQHLTGPSPAIVRAGMGGDRAAVVFARPEDMPITIRRLCP